MNIENKLIKNALLKAIEQSVIKKEGKPDKSRKFDETVDLIVNLRDLDIKNPSNRIDIEHLLPHPIKNNILKSKIAFIAKGDLEVYLKENGYNVFNPDFLDTLQKKSNKEKKGVAKKYDYFIAQADLMRDLAKVLARYLGQQGKMPKPQPKGYGVIRPNENLEDYIPKLERMVKLTIKKQTLVQTKIGKKTQDPHELLENIDSALSVLENHLPGGAHNIKSIYLKTTMGPAVKVEEPVSKKGR